MKTIRTLLVAGALFSRAHGAPAADAPVSTEKNGGPPSVTVGSSATTPPRRPGARSVKVTEPRPAAPRTDRPTSPAPLLLIRLLTPFTPFIEVPARRLRW
ncbi:MAG: hypothetical protein HZA93_13840 [Verrucomicrobia bacterium]|nr:hypothetical protein [Verrucomicrobiota bacterium]